MKGCYLENKIEEDEQPIFNGMHFCNENPCSRRVEEDRARLEHGFVTKYINMLEPIEMLDYDMMPDLKLGDEVAQKLQDGWTAERNHSHNGWILYPPKHEPSDFQEWEDQYTAGEPQTPALWMIIVMAVGAVAVFYGVVIGVAYLLT